MSRWANEFIPVFPIYQYQTHVATTAEMTGDDYVNYPAGTVVELDVFKKFNYTALICELSCTGYMQDNPGLVTFSVVPNARTEDRQYVTQFYFNDTDVHHQIHGISGNIELPVGEHTISLYAEVPATRTFTMTGNDTMTFRVWEQPPLLQSGDQWG